MKYFFAGIKGSGMAGLACMLKNLGNDVIGCDDTKVYTFTEDALYENDIKVYKDAYFLTSDMIFIYTAAIHEDQVVTLAEANTIADGTAENTDVKLKLAQYRRILRFNGDK